MSSVALSALHTALQEIGDLPVVDQTTRLRTLRRARAVGRAQTVLLSSHFERYVYAVNEEAVTFLNNNNIISDKLPQLLKLLHSKEPLEQISNTSWERRSEKLSDLISEEGWLWNSLLSGTLMHARLLSWMITPTPENLRRYYRYWGVDDIFSAITRSRQTRNRLWLGVQELVDKRNNIAHGDYAAQATPSDVRRYTRSVALFCSRADVRLARVLARLCSGDGAW